MESLSQKQGLKKNQTNFRKRLRRAMLDQTKFTN